MIVRTLEEIIGTDNEVKADNWVSRRLLLKDDNMGFSYHDTIIYAGTETHIWYKNHLEAVYCVGGEGEIETISDGKVYPIKDGTMYALDKNDEHYLRATKDMRMICVFNPPLTGRETHDKDGVYPLVED
ncbi:ectoine synthase [Bacillus norwichensis]|uniref:L-ectoine synthase n=1 Tax=Bacillus norwichensis TaxID=2762217 RepID=A0ABR8VL58_9BACI|nr:ectoine synthase [Bacillus norwichensis]MBD8005494.1 ectoine synthase [Bacillus norwichensis]